MRDGSEATRQIVEFEELVSRLDRINDLHGSNGSNTSTTLTSHRPMNVFVSSYTTSSVRSSPYPRQETAAGSSSFPRSCREDASSKRVSVNIGIDEDLRMILEMDPSIVDRQLPQTTSTNTMVNNNCWAEGAQPPRVTGPQGWY